MQQNFVVVRERYFVLKDEDTKNPAVFGAGSQAPAAQAGRIPSCRWNQIIEVAVFVTPAVNAVWLPARAV
jgi:hypothetical protein